MKTTHDNPVDPLGSLGAPIRPAAPAKPDVIKPFEAGDHSQGIANADKVMQPIVDTLTKQPEPDYDMAADFADAYTRALLGCI
jgi:hypothetical protein